MMTSNLVKPFSLHGLYKIISAFLGLGVRQARPLNPRGDTDVPTGSVSL